jgi:hypothetical protein
LKLSQAHLIVNVLFNAFAILNRSFLDPATRPSSCGTPWPSASTPSRRRVTLIGCPAFGSRPTTRTPSSSPAGGTDTSRSVKMRFARKLMLRSIFCQKIVVFWIKKVKVSHNLFGVNIYLGITLALEWYLGSIEKKSLTSIKHSIQFNIYYTFSC